MSEKKQRIIQTALRLFGEKGPEGVSTRQLAAEAEVSEGLIFRHFHSKEGLLSALMEEAAQVALMSSLPALNTQSLPELIEATLRIPFAIKNEDRAYWQLIYRLKWQSSPYPFALSAPLRKKLENAFQEAGDERYKAKAEALLLQLDGLAAALLLREFSNEQDLLQVLKEQWLK